MGVSFLGGLTTDISWLAWAGAFLLLAGEILALINIRRLSRLLLFSTLAETGYLLLGLGLENQSGVTGAWMHLIFQTTMRLLVFIPAVFLIKSTGSDSLDRLSGSASRYPVAALLFGFGMFSVMGLSPFKGSFSKFLILYGAMEQGEWLLAAIATLATILAAVYYIIVIQRICLERPDNSQENAPIREQLFSPLYILMYFLTAITIYMSLQPEPFLHFAEGFAMPSLRGSVPIFETPWRFLVILPYISGFALYFIGRINARARDIAAVVISAVTLWVAWHDGGLDGLSRLFALLFAAMLLIAVIYSHAYMRHDAHVNRYYFFLFLMGGSLLGVASAHDFGNFYLFWELMTWSSYLLVVHDQSGPALKAGRTYFLMCAGGAYVMHFGILLCHARFGSFDMAQIASQAAALPAAPALVIAACFVIGLGVKAGLYPMHSWLPQAHPVAPSPVSALMSGILTKVGVYGLIKVLLVIFGAGVISRAVGFGFSAIGILLSLMGCLTLIYGEIMAWREPVFKRILAFSTLAQVGEIMAMVGLATYLSLAGALLHVMNHAIFKSLLFLAAGAVISRAGGKRLSDVQGLGRVMPFTALCFAIGALAVMGLPPFSGFYSKFLMIYAAAQAGQLAVAVLFLLGSIIGAVYYLRILRLLFFAPYPANRAVDAPDVNAPALDAPPAMRLAMGILAAMVIAGGLWPDIGLDYMVRPAVDLIAARQGFPVIPLPHLNLVWSPAALIAVCGALLTFVMGKKAENKAGLMAVAVMAVSLAAVLIDAGRYDLLSWWFALLIAGVGLLNLLYAVGYMAHGRARHRFFFFFVFMIGGLLGLAGSKDLFNFFAFWEIMSSWTLYFVIIHDETEHVLDEGFKYFIFNFTGATCMFLGIAMLGARAGGFEFDAVARAAVHMPLPWFGGALLLVLAGLLMKAAQLPRRIDYQMHPPTAPTPVSGYISAVLLKSGAYGVLKLFTLGGAGVLFARLGANNGMTHVMYGVAIIAGVTLLYAGAMAVIQNGIKRLLIYSTVSQLGYILLGIALSTPTGMAGGLMHLVNHMMLKDILFMAAGCIMAQVHVDSLDELGGLGRKMPVTFGLFLFAGLSLSGIPPLNGFASKWLIYQAAFQSGHYLLGLSAMMSSLFTLAAVLKFAHAAFMGVPTPRLASVREAPAAMLAPMLLLSAGCMAVGMFPGLLLVPISHVMQALALGNIAATWTGALPGAGGWQPLSLWVFLLASAACGLLFYRLSNRRRVSIHLHQGGVTDITPAEAHVPASGLYEAPERFIRLALRPSDRE